MGLDLIQRDVIANRDNPLGLTSSNLLILRVDAPVKIIRFTLESVLVVALALNGSPIAKPGTAKRDLKWRKQ